MKKIATLLAVSALTGILAVPAAYAQRGPKHGGGGWGVGGQYGRMYDTNTIESISGEVISVDRFTPGGGMASGVHLQVKTEKGTISVHLGPSWYLDNQEFQVKAKDKIEVTGSRVAFEGKPAIIAAEVKRGEEVLKLRDSDGFPRWAGWRRR